MLQRTGQNIIKNICDVYPVESNLKIAYLNQGPAFNGYNDKNFNYLSSNNIKNFKDSIKFDLDYIDNWSFAFDLYIIFMTIPTILKGKGK